MSLTAGIFIRMSPGEGMSNEDRSGLPPTYEELVEAVQHHADEAQKAQAGWVKEIQTNRVLRHQIIALQKDARNRT